MSHESFLRAIIADPADDLPRLVYADWLDENGDPDRAEFIRVQCELAKLPEDDPRRPGLEDREHDLLDANEGVVDREPGARTYDARRVGLAAGLHPIGPGTGRGVAGDAFSTTTP